MLFRVYQRLRVHEIVAKRFELDSLDILFLFFYHMVVIKSQTFFHQIHLCEIVPLKFLLLFDKMHFETNI